MAQREIHEENFKYVTKNATGGTGATYKNCGYNIYTERGTDKEKKRMKKNKKKKGPGSATFL